MTVLSSLLTPHLVIWADSWLGVNQPIARCWKYCRATLWTAIPFSLQMYGSTLSRQPSSLNGRPFTGRERLMHECGPPPCLCLRPFHLTYGQLAKQSVPLIMITWSILNGTRQKSSGSKLKQDLFLRFLVFKRPSIVLLLSCLRFVVLVYYLENSIRACHCNFNV